VKVGDRSVDAGTLTAVDDAGEYTKAERDAYRPGNCPTCGSSLKAEFADVTAGGDEHPVFVLTATGCTNPICPGG
jgi:hypothetical protein